MKNILIKCCAAVLLVSCGGETSEEVVNEMNEVSSEIVPEAVQEEVVNSFLLESKKVGLFSIGQEVPELPKELKIRQYTETEQTDEGPGEELLHNVIFNQLEDVIELIMDHQMGDKHHEDKNIEEMLVLSNYYETAEEIGVGSTIEEFQEAYPDAELWYTYVSDRYVAETTALPGVQFMFDEKDCIKKPNVNGDQNMMKFEHFKEGAKISKIRVF